MFTRRQMGITIVSALAAIPASRVVAHPATPTDARPYRSPQFGYEVAWDAPWHLPVGPGTVPSSSGPGSWDRVVLLYGNDRGDVPVSEITAYLEVTGEALAADTDPADRLREMLAFWSGPEFAGAGDVTVLLSTLDTNHLTVFLQIDAESMHHLMLVDVDVSDDETYTIASTLRAERGLFFVRLGHAQKLVTVARAASFPRIDIATLQAAIPPAAPATPRPG